MSRKDTRRAIRLVCDAETLDLLHGLRRAPGRSLADIVRRIVGATDMATVRPALPGAVRQVLLVQLPHDLHKNVEKAARHHATDPAAILLGCLRARG
ncbi:hypothetical protein [Chachezhania sediminis]|uniref:hypothetical protein n=1 Tax=Chachezhania sediminis TaxID=2599291 RepID=UPI00131DAC9D|nr:hypothetical protein [Chachezhania sediminis]